MRGNLPRTLNFLNGAVNLNASDFASDSDNQWTDGANVDAHVYAGYTYDYYQALDAAGSTTPTSGFAA